MEVMWLCVLGLMLAGWSVLDGGNLGLGMSLRRIGTSGPERRLLLTALGPFLLSGEVWLIAGAGLLIGAFPGVEKDVLHAAYPVVVALLVGWVLRDVGVWFRSRRPSARWRGGWERTIVAASTVMAFAWGMLLGNLAQGVPHDSTTGLGTLVGPYSLLWGATMVAVFTSHGAVFAALRMPRERRERSVGIARRAIPVAGVLLGATILLTPAFSLELAQPVPALLQLVAIVAIVAAGRLLQRERDGWAYVCTAFAAAAPLVAVGVAVAPRLLDGAAGSGTLDLLTAMALPVIPVLLAVQAWLWWVFRIRVSTRSAVFF